MSFRFSAELSLISPKLGIPIDPNLMPASVLDEDLAILCTFYEVEVGPHRERASSLDSVATEPDVTQPQLVRQYRNEILKALAAEFGLSDKVLALPPL